MHVDISSIAFGFIEEAKKCGITIKLGRSHQCVAASLGYASLAALQASPEWRERWDFAHLVINPEMLRQRLAGFGFDGTEPALLRSMVRSFRKRLQGVLVHESVGEFQEAFLAKADRLVRIGGSPYQDYELGEITDLWCSWDWSSIESEQPGDGASGGIYGFVDLVPRRAFVDKARAGVFATVSISRSGRALWNVSIEDIEIDIDDTPPAIELFRDGQPIISPNIDPVASAR